MKVLITGAEGFIGSHLTELLVRDGHSVRAFVLYNSFNSWGWLEDCAAEVRDQFAVIPGDVRDPYSVYSAIRNCDAVIHLAALIAIPYSYKSPHTYVDTNVKGTLNVLQAVRDLSVEKMIHTSTSEVYGSAQFVPITETHPLHGQSPYSATKIGAEQIAMSFFESFETPVTILRPFNTYGPRQSARAIIPTVITQIASGKRRLELGSTHPTRDFSYITDTVTGFSAALSSARSLGEVINLGSNYEISIYNVVNMIADIMGVEVSIETDQQRLRPEKSEVDRLLASNEKARNLLGWKPEYGNHAGLNKGLSKTIDWLSTPENLGRYKSTVYNV